MKWDQRSRPSRKKEACPIFDEFMADEIHVGTREDLIGRLQRKYGYSREKAETQAWPIFLVLVGGRVRNVH